MNQEALFWDNISLSSKFYWPPFLMDYRDWEVSRHLDKWLPLESCVSVKTDVFEESFGYTQILKSISCRSKLILCLDISKGFLCKAKKEMPDEKNKWLAADISDIPVLEGRVDLVYSTNTYGYLKNIDKGLKEAYRILKKGGAFIIIVRNRSNFVTYLSVFLNFMRFPFSRPLNRDDLLIALKGAGFEIKGSEFIMHSPFFLNYLFLVLRNIRNRTINNVLLLFIECLKKFSLTKSILKKLTAKFIICYAVKPN